MRSHYSLDSLPIKIENSSMKLPAASNGVSKRIS
jgi:hypothetical protein